LKAIRNFLGLTQQEFGILLGGIQATTVSRREREEVASLSWGEVINLDKALEKKGKRLSDFTASEDTQSAQASDVAQALHPTEEVVKNESLIL
jgi:transcriptional regulator with XRE-family HTH domain